MSDTSIPIPVRNEITQRVVLRVDAGGLLPGKAFIYDDTAARPAHADDPVPPSAVLLGTITFRTPAFLAPVNGSSLAFMPVLPSRVLVRGRALWFRVFDGLSATVWDGSVGLPGSAAGMEVSTLTFLAGAAISVSVVRYTTPER
jgi:hypothetical protein